MSIVHGFLAKDSDMRITPPKMAKIRRALAEGLRDRNLSTRTVLRLLKWDGTRSFSPTMRPSYSRRDMVCRVDDSSQQAPSTYPVGALNYYCDLQNESIKKQVLEAGLRVQ
jgi:hypothetical protein